LYYSFFVFFEKVAAGLGLALSNYILAAGGYNAQNPLQNRAVIFFKNPFLKKKQNNLFVGSYKDIKNDCFNWTCSSCKFSFPFLLFLFFLLILYYSNSSPSLSYCYFSIQLEKGN